MYDARQILLLAAEDAFEFEKWRDAGPVIGDIDPEARAAEIAEFEALGIPMPAELDSLRRELEHAPKVSEAIRNSAIALRRSGRASASSLVALGPQQLMHPGARMGWMDPRLMAAQMAYMGMSAEPMPMQIRAEPPQSVASRSRRPRERKLADATVVAEDGPLEAEVVERRYDDDDDDDDVDDDDDDADDDEFEQPSWPRKRESAGKAKRKGARQAKPARSREWDEDDEEDDDDDISIVAAPVPVGSDRNTLIFGGIAAVAVIAMLFMMFNKDDPPPAPPIDPALAQQQQQPPPPQPVPPPAPPPQPAIDPNTGLPYGQAPAPVAEAPPPAPSSGGRGGGGGGSRGSGVRGSSTPASSGGSINPFADFKTDPTGGGPAPAGGGQAPAPAPQPTPAGGGQAPAPADQATPPAEQPQPAEPPKSDDSLLTKSKMTPAIREAVVGKVGELQACYQDAMVGKPDLAGKVVFVISIDQDGVVTKVSTSVDEVGYGVAKCSAKKIKRWTLPSAGIPIIFDLPFDFKS